MEQTLIQNVKFNDRGLIPAILQDKATSEVVALCYMDDQSLVRTLQTGQTFSVTERLSGVERHYPIVDVRVNPDGESLTVVVERESAGADHRPPTSITDLRGPIQSAPEVSLVDVSSMEFGLALNNLYSLITERREKRPEGSYTTYLFNSGLDKILKKIAEESGEVIIASKNKSPREIVSELADLFYHLLVLMVERDVKLSDVHDELERRANLSPKLSEKDSREPESPTK